MPLSITDGVAFGPNGHGHHGQVIAIGPYAYIAVEADDGALWLEVVFNRSFASWSRMVKLASGTPLDALENISEQIAYHVERKTVDDIPEAERLAPPDWRIG